ncbi:MAG: hypothetical protein KYX69_20165 [Sphingomonas sp.]|uniref:hypothetical protein n=1 Tax=Sphingomonas sp. TaxID=28214 RepID=UPI002622FECC|nr:hypothetical protein [Sphingomonas sp.]MDK2770021.1 hypothetical protein [Sphingomonas sp.]
MIKRLAAGVMLASFSLAAAPASASSGTPPSKTAADRCDRACMTRLADGLVASMVARNPGAVPLTQSYRASENGVAAALPMMSLWRTPSEALAKQYLIDASTGEMFIVVTLREGGPTALFWGRLKVEEGRFSELELFLTRSRADAGYQYDADGMSSLPTQWTRPVEAKRLMPRDALHIVGSSMFSPKMESPAAHPDCRLMENGKIVGEEPEMMAFMLPEGAPLPEERLPDGSIPMLCPIVPERPADPHARVIADAATGLVVAIATVEGIVQPYPVTTPSWSAFVPGEMVAHYHGALARANATGKYKSETIAPLPATIFVAQMFRVYDGKVQGMHLFQKMSAPGSRSIWVSTAPATAIKPKE